MFFSTRDFVQTMALCALIIGGIIGAGVVGMTYQQRQETLRTRIRAAALFESVTGGCSEIGNGLRNLGVGNLEFQYKVFQEQRKAARKDLEQNEGGRAQ